MRLYEAPDKSRIRVVGEVAVPPSGIGVEVGDELNYNHIDGMYSYCTRDDGTLVHLVAWAEVEVIESGPNILPRDP